MGFPTSALLELVALLVGVGDNELAVGVISFAQCVRAEEFSLFEHGSSSAYKSEGDGKMQWEKVVVVNRLLLLQEVLFDAWALQQAEVRSLGGW
jgi:hypothetical protein